MIVADVPIYQASREGAWGEWIPRWLYARASARQTPYSQFGDWLVAACGTFLLVYSGFYWLTSHAK